MSKEYKIFSERLKFREITPDDFASIYNILKNEEVMYAWEHGFTEKETREWIQKNISRYKNEGYGYFAAIEKNTENFIGVIGLINETIHEKQYIGLAYILDKKYWGFGYATEGVKACINYAYDILKAEKVIAEIRTENIRSCEVAERTGMTVEGEFIKSYKGESVKHVIYSISKNLEQI